MIHLPYGGIGATFYAIDLIEFMNDHLMDHIIQGQQNCSLADHTKPHSLDYWLRANYAHSPDTKQATNEVVEQLIESGFFELIHDLPCPDSGQKCKGLKLKK